MHRLTTLLGVTDVTRALHEGRIPPELVTLSFTGDKEAVKRFPEAIRQERFDVTELPIITYLIAREHGFPFKLVPAVVLARLPYQHLVQRADQPTIQPDQLPGKSVAIRSWSVTTVAQVRDVLRYDYGIDPTAIDWISTEPPHVPEFSEPDCVRPAAPGLTPADLLLSGQASAAILGGRTVDRAYRSLFDNTWALTRSWRARSGGSLPVNHVVAVRASIAKDSPNLVRDLFRQLAAANAAAIAAEPDLSAMHPIGFASCRAGLQRAISMAQEQMLIRSAPSPESLVAECLLDT